MYKFLLFIIFFHCICPVVKGQPGHYREVVLEVSAFSPEKHKPLINFSLKPSLGESYVSAICETNGWVVIALDLNSGATEEQLLQLLKPTGIGFIIKHNANAEQVKRACNGQFITYPE